MAKQVAKKRSATSKKRSQPKPAKVFSFQRKKHALVVGLVFVSLFGGIGLWMLRASSAATTNIDTTNKAAVNNAYWSLYGNNTGVTSGWTGSVNGCIPGNISAAARAAQINAVNFARRLSGLTPIVGANLTDSVQGNVQRAALIMDANQKLSHEPPSTWKCYRDNGAVAASKSNLSYSSVTLLPTGVIRSYLKDYGENNTAVGHRRWILYPAADVFAFGMTNHAAATQVVRLGTDATNSNPQFVPWPSDHWFPTTLDPQSGTDAPGGFWSLSGRAGACFDKATVSVTRNSYSVPVTVTSRIDHYGNPAIVWRMPKNLDHTGVYAYVVNVSNINQKTSSGSCSTSSASRTSYQYPVRFFTPAK